MSRRPHKRWTPEAFAETARRIHAESGAGFVLAGGPGEEPALSAVAAGLGGVPHRVRAFRRLGDLAGLLAGADLFFGNDNGPRHIALALGVATLAWFGTQNPTHWTPPGPGPHRVIWDPARAAGRPVRPDLPLVADRPEAAAAAGLELLAAAAASP